MIRNRGGAGKINEEETRQKRSGGDNVEQYKPKGQSFVLLYPTLLV